MKTPPDKWRERQGQERGRSTAVRRAAARSSFLKKAAINEVEIYKNAAKTWKRFIFIKLKFLKEGYSVHGV